MALWAIWASANAPEYTPGWASAYAPGVFEEVVALRLVNDWWRSPLPVGWYQAAGYAAVRDCDKVGKVIEMRPAGAPRWHKVLVGDCVGDWATLEWMIGNDIVAELDHRLYSRWVREYGAPLRLEIRE